MDRKAASTIVEQYVAVLGETAAMVSGVPESKLPCDKEGVQEAILHVLTHTSKEAEEYFYLQEAYTKLATFIPDEEARIAALAEEAVMSMDVASEGFKYLAKHADIQMHIQTAFQELTEELYAWGKTQADY